MTEVRTNQPLTAATGQGPRLAEEFGNPAGFLAARLHAGEEQ